MLYLPSLSVIMKLPKAMFYILNLHFLLGILRLRYGCQASAKSGKTKVLSREPTWLFARDQNIGPFRNFFIFSLLM